MEYRPIEVKLISAKDLKDVNVFSTMDVYVIGSVSGDPRNMQRSPVHKDGGVNPEWNFQLRFAVDESAARLNRLGLVFQIMSERTLGDREIGRVYVPLKELFDAGDGNSGEDRPVTYQVQTPSGKFKGVLEFTFKFGEKFIQSLDWTLDDPVRTYPAGAGAGTAPGEERGNPSLVESPLSGYLIHGYGYEYGYAPLHIVLPLNPRTGYGYGYPHPATTGYGCPLPVSPRLCTCGANGSEAAQ